MSEKILIVDDEKDIAALLRDYFELNEYEVLVASSGEQALELAEQSPNIILLDINMPGMNGMEVCKRLRGTVDVPIIFLTARTEVRDIINGLEIGADDYITKPFNLIEVGTRVDAHLRREKRVRNIHSKDGLYINYSEMAVSYNGEYIPFTRKEFEIIEFLSMNTGQIFDREKIYERIWGYDSEGNSEVVTEHIRRIRAKFAAAGCTGNIYTVWGVGYRWIK